MKIYDVVGVGFGPANIALAVALKELAPGLSSIFIERNASSEWHANMLLSGSDIQNNPLRDLVTPRNPMSYFTFVNFLKEEGRLFEHLNLGVPFPLRVEYFQYIQWVAKYFDSQVVYNGEVVDIFPYFEKGSHQCYEVIDKNGKKYYGRSIVLAPGRAPHIPKILSKLSSENIIHSDKYLSKIKEFSNNNFTPKSISVIGSSQSAVEITLDLRKRYPDTIIDNIIRNFGFRQKDLSPFTGEVYYPEFCDYYFETDINGKKALDADLRYTNYSSADHDVINQFYLEIYEDKILKKNKNRLFRNSELVSANLLSDNKRIKLILNEKYRNTKKDIVCDLVISATGFLDMGPEKLKKNYPKAMGSLMKFLKIDEYGCPVIGRDYNLETNLGETSSFCPIILNGLCEKSHGMGDAGSFSLLALRSERIVKHIEKKLKKDPLCLELEDNVPYSFSVSEEVS